MDHFVLIIKIRQLFFLFDSLLASWKPAEEEPAQQGNKFSSLSPALRSALLTGLPKTSIMRKKEALCSAKLDHSHLGHLEIVFSLKLHQIPAFSFCQN
jgi:hypothetical protein